MKTNRFKKSFSFLLALTLLLGAISLPTAVSPSLTEPLTVSAAASAPGKVTGLTAKSNSSAVALSWKKVSGASGYNICRYDTAKKRYVSVANVTGTSATVKKLSYATVYRFAVRAYKKSGKNVSYGAFSSQVVIATRPLQVTGLKAARTADSVTLEWDGQKSAVAYAVYRYDAAKKKYYSVGKTKDNTITVKGLKSGVTYYFTVKAYLTVNKVNYTAPLSSLLKVQTLKSGYKISKYHKIVAGGQYTVNTVLKSGSDSFPTLIAVKNGNTVMKSSFEGINVRMIRNGNSGKTYMVIDNLYKYAVVTDKDMTESMKPEVLAGAYAPAVSGNIKTGTKTIGGKKYNYEYFRDINSTRYIYYYNSSTLVRIDVYNESELQSTIMIKSFTASADSSLFSIPRYYTKMNISWIENL